MQVTNVTTNDGLSISPFIDNVGSAVIQGIETEFIGGVPLASNFGLGSLSYAPPRTFGLDFSYQFGD